MSDRNAARIRTALPQCWAALALYLFDRYGIAPDDLATDAIIYAAVPALGAVIYDTARTLEAHGWHRTARFLLGSARQPVYTG